MTHDDSGRKLDREIVIKAIVDAEIGPTVKEESGRLVEGWLASIDKFPEFKWKTVAVETPFYIQLEPNTYIVGQMDGVFKDEAGTIFAEWKSRRAPKLKRDGTAYAGDDEDGWLAEISNGPQLGVYALAGREGAFITGCPTPDESGEETFAISEPRILVRAAVKSNPVTTWPGDWRKGFFAFPGPLLDVVRTALLSEAASIRARRRLGVVPWQLPGLHCTNMYHRTCEYLESVCLKRTPPPVMPVGWRHPSDKAPDPGFDVCQILGLDINDPELVVLSQSALQAHYQCAERGRIAYGGYFPGEESFEMSVGTGLHRGLGALYRQLIS
jgi:hypothetical protein